MSRSVAASTTATDAHRAAMDWLADNPGILATYVGEWVAIADEQVIAHGPSMGDVEVAAGVLGYDDPLLVPVMPASFIGD